MSGPRVGAHALAGLVAGVAGIAVSHAVTMLLNVRATPLLAVGEAVIALTPGRISEPLIQLVGQKDKPLLVAGVSTVVLLAATLAGLTTRPHPRSSQSAAGFIFLGLGLLGGLAVWSRPGFSPYDWLPVVAGTLTWVVVLSFLVAGLNRAERTSLSAAVARDSAGRSADETAGSTAHQPAQAQGPSDLNRRRFLLRAGAVALVAAVVGFGGEVAGRARRGVETSRRLLRLPVTPGKVPRGAEVGVDGVAPWRSANASFYRIDTALVVPTIEPADWRLRIHGMVDKELVLTLPQLLERTLTESWVTICCVSNEVGGDLIGNAWWSGVRVADLLAEAGVQDGADAVLQTSEDGWNCGTPLAALTDDRNALVAVAMNGEALPLEHGFPARMVVPGLYGYVSATKWLVDIEVTRFDRFTAYWTDRGWSAEGPVRTQSRIDVPESGDTVAVGTTRIGGSAWAQHTGVETVEVRLDGGEWTEAELGRVPGADTWVQWSAALDVAAGDHTVAVRATDRSGYTQTGVRRDVIPDGATGWHTVDFVAR